MDKKFDFMSATEPEVETATSGNPKKKAIKLPKKKIEKVDENVKLLPTIIAEARRLAGSRKGLDIDAFFKKYNISYNIETLLNAPLDKDGNIK